MEYFGFAAIEGGVLFQGFFEEFYKWAAGFFVGEEAGGAAEGEFIGDDVIFFAAFDKAQGEGEALEGVYAAGAEGAELLVQCSEAVHGVIGQVGAGAVAEGAVQFDDKGAAAGHDGAGGQGDGAGGHIPADVGGVAAVDGHSQLVYQVGEEVLDVAAFFFAAFKAEENFAGPFFCMGGQDPGGGKGHGHVGVVAAGVGKAGAFGKAGFGAFQVVGAFLDGQGVGVGSKEQGFAGFAAVQDAQEAGVGDIAGGDVLGFEVLFQVGDGFGFLVAGFGVFMKMAAQAKGFVELGLGLFEYFHGHMPLFVVFLRVHYSMKKGKSDTRVYKLV